jgi:hypothetical protein
MTTESTALLFVLGALSLACACFGAGYLLDTINYWAAERRKDRAADNARDRIAEASAEPAPGERYAPIPRHYVVGDDGERVSLPDDS